MLTEVDILTRSDDDLGMDILQALLSDESINPEFRRTLATQMDEQQKAGYLAKRDYLDRCAAAGEKPDPIMADRVYWQAYNDAQPPRKMMA